MKADSIAIPFIHRPSARARGVKISLSSDGTVIVTTPPRFPTWRIPRYIEQAKKWILLHQAQQKSKPQLLTSSTVYIFGLAYTVVKKEDADGSIQIQGKTLFVSPLPGHTAVETIAKWLRARATEYILPRIDTLSHQMELSYNKVAFKQQKTRWGSCSSDRNLNFNWKLIHAPRKVIDYVVIHELAHLQHMNHGKRFWDLVAKYDPGYPLHRRWLNTYGDTED